MPDVPKADWWPRVGATVIDTLILFAGALAVAVLFSSTGSDTDQTRIAIYVTFGGGSLLYSPLLMARPGDDNGQTLGKRAVGIRVIHADGGPMTIQRGLQRDALGKLLLSFIPLYSIADALAPLFDSGRQAFHDRIGSTYVVPATVSPAGPGGLPQVRPADAATPHPAWSAPSQPVAPPPPPPPSAAPEPPTAPDRPLPPPPGPPEDPPDLGGFAPPGAPAARDDGDDARGPFGPTYG